MSKITIELTEQQEMFLKEFAAKQYSGSNDNAGTEQPIHLVQTRRTRVIDPDYDCIDEIQYNVPYWGESYESPKELVEAYYEDNTCAIPIISFSEAYDDYKFKNINGEEDCICDEEDYFRAYGVPEDFYYKVCLGHYYETVAVFFILDEARKYMKYQKHNLCHPRTYTIGAGYANKGEYHHFWKLLFNIGEQLNNSEKNGLGVPKTIVSGLLITRTE